jgi:hypothetical protein
VDFSTQNLVNSNAFGEGAKTTIDNSISLGNSSILSIKGQVSPTTYSDARVKTDIQENVPGLAFIKKLHPVTYRYDIHRQNELMGIKDIANWPSKYDIEKMTFTGFLAQDVEAAARSIGYDFSGVDAPKNDKTLYGLRYAEFTVPLVKAVQEQQAIIEGQKTEITDLKTQLTALQQQMQTLSADVQAMKSMLVKKEVGTK